MPIAGGDTACDSAKKTAAERIFETARALFYQRGVRAVGVDEIVSQAGVTKPSLYRAYASKDELVAACLQESAREAKGQLESLLADASPEPREQLLAILRHYAVKIGDPEFRGCPLSNTAVEFPDPDCPGRIVLESCKGEMRTLLVDLSRRLRVPDPEALANGLVLLLEGAMASHHVYGTKGPSTALVATGEALIDGHLRAPVPVSPDNDFMSD